MTSRPQLSGKLPDSAFRDHYWLKHELMVFCRENSLRTTGSKREISDRISAFLNGLPEPRTRRPRRNGPMPSEFTRSTVVGIGWRCSQQLRAFFTMELGRTFRFDEQMRDAIQNGNGRTLGEIYDEWLATQSSSRCNKIAPQFEYNRFMREFRQFAPCATHKGIVGAWKTYRNTPKSARPPMAEFARKFDF